MRMLFIYLGTVAAIVTMTATWVWVQRAWARSFPEHREDSDVLACRGNCHSCGCSGKTGGKPV